MVGQVISEGGVHRDIDRAGYKASRLLLQQEPNRFRSLDLTVVRKWIPVIVSHLLGSPSEQQAQARLASEVYLAAPDDFVVRLSEWIDELSRGEFFVLPIFLWSECWDNPLASMLTDKVRDPSLKLPLFSALLNELFERSVIEARAFTASLLDVPLPTNEILRERTRIAAVSLLMKDADAGWDIIGPLLVAEVEFSRNFVLSIAARVWTAETPAFPDRLSESQLAEFFLWLSQHFPASHEDDRFEEKHSSRRDIAHLRESRLQQLAERGTVAAVDALNLLARELPHQVEIGSYRPRAERVMLEKTWTAHDPGHLRKLILDRKARLVDSGEQLLDMIIESLGRYEARLHDETPAIFMLWGRQAGGHYRPKEEDRLSDALKLHLEADLKGRGIIANREVEIHMGPGGKSGEYTDIHVDAIVGGPHARPMGRISVIVEVKGCWNRGVRQSMETQLRNRYLKDNSCCHGLYVVGWYLCDAWDEEHGPKIETQRGFTDMTLDQVRELFDLQAKDLSKDGVTIKALVLDIRQQKARG
ncbi:hypothetical protein [Singulisphaera acidiphila]|uniref:hypothetical protein n=1 Tax=Singulisphaera acidiphila TaxID=466153 RepID=UPI00031926F5|nr:hypothetical protein [Singulisphaera acidiphila]